jgi:hypothetical protein
LFQGLETQEQMRVWRIDVLKSGRHRSHPKVQKPWQPASAGNVNYEQFAAVHESESGTNPTCRGGLTMSVDRGRPDGAGPRSK